MLFALTPGKEITAHREPDGVVHAYVTLKKPQEWMDAIDFTDAAAATAHVAAEFHGWAPQLTALITDGETAPVPRTIHALPIEHRWDRVPGVTLLGDAAHLMPPSGEGANLAMYDGAELGNALAATRTTPRPRSPRTRRLCSRAPLSLPPRLPSSTSCAATTTPPHGLVGFFTDNGQAGTG